MSKIDLGKFIEKHSLVAHIGESDPPEGWVDNDDDWEHYRAIISRVTPESLHFGSEAGEPLVYTYSVIDEGAPSLPDVLGTMCCEINEYEGTTFEDYCRNNGMTLDNKYWMASHAIGIRNAAAARAFFGPLIDDLIAAYNKPMVVEEEPW